MPPVVKNDCRMPARIGSPMTSSSTSIVGDSMIAASRPCPSSGDFHSLTFLGPFDPAGGGCRDCHDPSLVERWGDGLTLRSPHRHVASSGLLEPGLLPLVMRLELRLQLA